MDDSRIAMKEKLEFVGIIKEALKIPIKNPKFIFTILLTFFPLFCSLCLHETMFQRALIESLRSQADDPPPHEGFVSIYRYSWPSLYGFRGWIGNFISGKLLVQSFTLLAIIHLFDLLNTIITVSTASAIYAQEKETLTKPFIENKVALFKGPLITSIYALLLNSLALVGLFTLSINIYVMWSAFTFFTLTYMLVFVALFTKYIEWSAVWNTGIVISILEQNKHGDVALGVSAYISRGSRKRGFLIMLVFFAWSFGLRLSSLCVGWQKVNVVIEVILAQACLDCLGSVMKWVAFMIYFYDCKKRFIEKKFDGSAEGKA
ncbi:hypothetical protein AB3S75_014818 [Citrus x aurantiifolia]